MVPAGCVVVGVADGRVACVWLSVSKNELDVW